MVDKMTQFVLSGRVDEEVKDVFDYLSTAMGRTKSSLVKMALERFATEEKWQIKKIMTGLKQIESGQTASKKRILEVFDEENL